MRAKKPAKKAQKKVEVAAEPNIGKENLHKDEIKEIVTETVEEVLKEKTKETEQPIQEESQSEAVPLETKPSEEKVPTEPEDAPESSAATAPPVMENTTESPSQATDSLPVQPSGEEQKEEPAVSQQVTNGQPLASTQPAETSLGSTPVVPPKKSSKIGLFIFFLLFGLVAGLGGLWYANAHNFLPFLTRAKAPLVVKPSPTHSPSPTASPTQIDLSKYTIEVLNGSGVTGEAAKAASQLTSAGFSVGSTGNASSSDFIQTVIKAKSSVDADYLAKLMQSLQQNYAVSQSTITLDNSATSDVVVTIGSSSK